MRALHRSLAPRILAGLMSLWGITAAGQVLLEDCTEDALQGAIEAGTVLIEEGCAVTLTRVIEINSIVQIIATGSNTVFEAEGTRIFEVQPFARLEVSGVTFTGGSNRLGGAIYIHENAEVVFSNCVFSANTALGADGTNGWNGSDEHGIGCDGDSGTDGTAGLGGAVFNSGTVTFIACEFVRNRAAGGQGGTGGDGGAGGYAGGDGGRGGNGAAGQGGAIYNAEFGTLVAWDSIFEANAAEGANGGDGGAGGTGPQSGSAGSGGQGAGAAGAGIFSAGFSEIVNCTFSTNSATAGDSGDDGSLNGGNLGGDGYDGGRAYGGALCNVGESEVSNSTFSQNRASGGAGGDGGDGRYTAGDGGNGGNAYGGGIYNSHIQLLMNSTLSQNGVAGGTNGMAGTGPTAGENGSLGAAIGASVFGNAGGEFYYKNSIFAYPAGSTNGAGVLTGMGHNISSDRSMPLGPNSFAKTDPLLYSLDDNGGLTPTMLPRTGSPAVNAGDMEGALEFDQRGFPRPSIEGTDPDIGAVEVGAPVIIEGPFDQEVEEGERVTFSVVVEGDPPFSYYWLRDGTNIPGARSSTYTIPSARPFQEGAYSVIVSNVAGFVESDAAFLTVSPGTPPTITLQPESRAVPPGANVTFTAGATGSEPLFVQWRSNNVALARATNWTLTLTNVKTSYSADYSVRVTNFLGAATSQVVRLTVALGAPVVTNQPRAQTVSVGANVNFTVGATGAPPLFVQWRSNNVAIPGQTNWLLSLQNVQTNYSADYTARVTNSIGPAISDIARLRVETAPPVTGTPIGTTNFNVTFQTVTGLTYVTEFKTNLSQASWIPLRTNIGTGLSVTNVDRMSNSPARFYRVRAQ